MTTSSQTPPGALPPEAPYPVVRPLHQAAFATFGLAVPAPAGPAETSPPAPSMTEAAAAVLDARIAQDGGATAEQLAEAEQHAGILFDPARVKAVADAARAQAYAEAAADLEGIRAELQDARRELAAMAGAQRCNHAVLRLCEGHRGDDLLMVAAVATAAECGSTALDGMPMTLEWDRSADIPETTNPDKHVTVRCRSSYGGRANLVVKGEDRQVLASLLDAELVRDIHAMCDTAGCGSDAADLDDTDMWGWARLDVVGTDDRPRWYCSPPCVSRALARAGEELAAADQLAAADPDEQVPYLPADDDAPEYLTEDQAVHGER